MKDRRWPGAVKSKEGECYAYNKVRKDVKSDGWWIDGLKRL
jgi:hypothetical protein